MRYTVLTREVWIQAVTVEADNPEQAKTMVAQGGGESIDPFEYSHVLDPEFWQVEEDPR